MTHDFTRRAFIGLGAAAVGSGVLAACAGGGSPRPRASGTSGPRTGGEIVYLNAMVNPGYQQQQIGSWHALQYWALFVEYLFYVNEKSELLPHLATGFTANSDFTKFSIGIRTGVTFSNGEVLNADAVAKNLDLFGLGDTKRAIPRVANLPQSYQRAVAVDEYEVEVSLRDPFPAFIRHLAGSSTTAILAPATIALPLAEQSDLSNTHATGPWTVQSWTPSKEVILQRRDDYAWPRLDAKHSGPAYLDKITIQQLTEDELRVGALESGQAQIIHYPQPSAEVGLAKKGFHVIDAFGPGSVWGLHIRITAPHVDDLRVRQALTRAVDRQQIVDTLYPPNWKVAQGPLNRATPWGIDLYEKFSYDPDLANRLLDEAGWTGRDEDGYRTRDGQTLELLEYPSVFITTSKSDLTLIAQQWQKVGIKLTLKNVDYDNYNTVTAPNLEPPPPLYEIHWGAAYPTFLWRWWDTGQQDQFDAPPGGRMDQLLTQITAAQTDQEAYALAARLQEFVIDNAYFIPVHEFPQNFAAAGNLQGITYDGYPRIQLYDAWLDA
ncbi:ABC transporter substrate-binding protein [Tsukamurella sp. 8F]|uniref:ABC transporter substrate-binding protein n=1 Tax=Tsukamurella sp. 8F TaxID=3031961 RepID=UPI0023BA288A|nr:ABC transporter substrate-binding protein [Tsukamurella sp. 8F]MDF0586062.1 ABC transporter substrate-binding protein [Tsukamurella sp. 8F]